MLSAAYGAAWTPRIQQLVLAIGSARPADAVRYLEDELAHQPEPLAHCLLVAELDRYATANDHTTAVVEGDTIRYLDVADDAPAAPPPPGCPADAQPGWATASAREKKALLDQCVAATGRL